jgi:phosphate transport system substrate-binding protein
MTHLNLTRIIGYAAAAMLLILGVSVLAGWVRVQHGPGLRTAFGVVLLLYAGYRLAVLRMKPRRGGSGRSRPWLIALLIAGFSSCQQRPKAVQDTPESGFLSIAVSESHASLMKAEADQFMRLYTRAHITILPMQSRQAAVALLNDSVPCAVLDRPFNTEEESVAAQSSDRIDSVYIAKDAIAVVVNLFNNLDRITPDGLRAVLDGRINDWVRIPGSGLKGAIQTASTGVNSGSYELLRDRFGLIPAGFVPAVRAADQNEVVRTVAGKLGAMGLVSLACLKDTSQFPVEKLKVRALDILEADSSGAPALRKLHQANVYLGKYPFHFPVVMYVCGPKSRLALGFSGFVASTQGQQLILNRGLVPATTPVRLVQLTSGSPE